MGLWSYRRTILDKNLDESKKYMRGLVLDLGGGRKRGSFKETGAKWIVVDIEKKFQPSVLADVHNLPFKKNVFNCIKCTELLEHLENPDMFIKEITRSLKPSGILILSTPFNFNIHSDPYDFQRFTDYKLKKMLESDFEINMIEKQGLYFTVLGDMLKRAAINTNSSFRYVLYLLIPVLDLFVKIDNSGFVKNSKYLSSFTTGFFVVAVKKRFRE